MDHCLELGDVFPPYRKIIINNDRHCFLDEDAWFYKRKVTLLHCIPFTQKEIFHPYREVS
jgi:hypothetical protein